MSKEDRDEYQKYFARSSKLNHSPVKTPVGQQGGAEHERRKRSPLDDAADLAAKKAAEVAILAEKVATSKREVQEAEDEEEEAKRQKDLATVPSQSSLSESSNPKRKRTNEDESLEDFRYSGGPGDQPSFEGAAREIMGHCDKLSGPKKVAILERMNFMYVIMNRHANEILEISSSLYDSYKSNIRMTSQNKGELKKY